MVFRRVCVCVGLGSEVLHSGTRNILPNICAIESMYCVLYSLGRCDHSPQPKVLGSPLRRRPSSCSLKRRLPLHRRLETSPSTKVQHLTIGRVNCRRAVTGTGCTLFTLIPRRTSLETAGRHPGPQYQIWTGPCKDTATILWKYLGKQLLTR
jgi:hypothetical protein